MATDPRRAERLVGLQTEKSNVQAERAAAVSAGADLTLIDAHLAAVTLEITRSQNADSLTAAAANAIANLDNAEGLINASGWDGLTVAQRKAVSLGLVRQQRAIIRLMLNLLDSPS